MKHRAFVNRIAVFFVPCLMLAAGIPASAQISVTATSPNSADQGTVNLTVTVNGKGFKKGAQAQWFVSGTTNPGGVVVNSTAFVNSNQLSANITVSDTAVIGNFDVQVMNSDGRTGKGTELFAVLAQGSSQSFQTCAQRAAALPKLNPTPNSCVSGTAGCLDTTFAGVGYESFDFAQGTSTADIEDALDVAVQGDKLIAIDQAQSIGTMVLRFNSDGSLDSTFGNGGKVLLSTNIAGNYWTKVLVQAADGYIVALVGSDLARLTPDGLIDSSFGVNGHVTLSTISAGAMRLQPDGKLLVGGNTPKVPGSIWGLVRLNPNGSLDTTFGNAGTVTYSPAKNLGGAVRAIAIQTVTTPTGSEDRIVAGGETGGSSGYFFTIARFLPNGAVDTSFGPSGTGVIRYTFQMNNQGPSGIAVDSMNRIVMAGQSQSDTCAESIDFAIVRVTPSGLPDTSFGDLNTATGSRTGQVLSVNFYGGGNHTRAMGLQPDDRIIVSGGVRNSANGITYAGVARLATDGTLDTSFGIGGAVALSTVGVEGMTLTADGKIVLSGSTVINNAMYSNFARLWTTVF